ncbi:MAG: hypothetical protein U0R69_14975 [Gaiellales bacterium]
MIAVVLLTVTAAALALAAQARAGEQQRCPEQSYLQFGDVYYGSQPVPATVTLPRGERLGRSEVDQPGGTDTCKREHIETDVFAIQGVDPSLAVIATGASSPGFVLGARCGGFDEAGLWACILNPLAYEGVSYTAIRYPDGVLPAGRLDPGDELGDGSLADGQVAVRALVGIEPAAAVAVADRPGEVYVAPGVCPYERPNENTALDDLARCLAAPIWLTFVPLGAGPGDTVHARGDRSAAPDLDGAPVGLVEVSSPTDALPDDLKGLIPIGTLERAADGTVSLTFTVPDLPEGFYETVVQCDACAEAYGGQTRFPAGSVPVLAKSQEKSGSQSAKVVYIVVFSLFIAALVGAIGLFLRGRRRRRRAAP